MRDIADDRILVMAQGGGVDEAHRLGHPSSRVNLVATTTEPQTRKAGP